MLSRPAASITLAQIAEAVDPSLLANTVRAEGQSGHAVQEAWESVAVELRKRLQAITLEQISHSSSAPMFHI